MLYNYGHEHNYKGITHVGLWPWLHWLMFVVIWCGICCEMLLMEVVWLERFSLNHLDNHYMLGCVGGENPLYLSYDDTPVICWYWCGNARHSVRISSSKFGAHVHTMLVWIPYLPFDVVIEIGCSDLFLLDVSAFLWLILMFILRMNIVLSFECCWLVIRWCNTN